MKVINQSFTFMERPEYTRESILKHLESVGRICYKSEDKMHDTSAAGFVRGLVRSGHEAMIEHFNFVFEIDRDLYDQLKPIRIDNIRCTEHTDRFIVSGNARAWKRFYKEAKLAGYGDQYDVGTVLKEIGNLIPELVGEKLNEEVQIIKNPVSIRLMTKDELLKNPEIAYYHLEQTVKFITDRGITHELVRHRPCSFAQESTRYCNYTDDKFGSELTFIDIRPGMELDLKMDKAKADEELIYNSWLQGLEWSEKSYFNMVNAGASPNIARGILPNSVKTEIVMTATIQEWFEVIKFLRTADGAHPQMREATQPLFREMTPYLFGELEADYENIVASRLAA